MKNAHRVFYRIETSNRPQMIYAVGKHASNEIISAKKYKKIQYLPMENEVFSLID